MDYFFAITGKDVRNALRAMLRRAQLVGPGAVALPVADEAMAPGPQRSKNRRKSESPNGFRVPQGGAER